MVVAPPCVIILNGPSSSGKSTIASILQRDLPDLWLSLGVDAFLSFLPLDQEARQLQIVTAFSDVFRGIHDAMAALAHAGNRVIIDHVLALPGSADELRRALGDTRSVWVGVKCPLDVLEQREMARADRERGLARSQVEAVHVGIAYDLEVDTSRMTADACAHRITGALQ